MDATCPAPEILQGYLKQTLPETESDRLRPHVVACKSCQATLGRLHLHAFGREHRRRRRGRRGGPWWLRAMVPWQAVAIVLAAAIIVAGLVGVYFLIEGA